jgi:hypothetical protein
MSKKLAIIAVAALGLSAALLGGAWLLGGDDVFHDPRSMEGLKPLIDLATRKEWRWAGGDTLALDAPVTLHYEPQGKPHVTITGPADAMDHIRFRAGRITSDAPSPPRNKARLQAVVSGVPIRKFVVNGGESLQLGNVDQDEMTIHVNGQGAVGGGGKVGHLTLVMNGPGAANLGALQVGDATVSILGPGDVTLSPHGALKLFVAGEAHIRLLTRPASIKRRILGAAIIETPDGAETTPPSVPPVPPVPPRPGRAATPPTPPTPPRDATPATAIPVPVPMPMTVPAPGASPGTSVVVRDSRNVDLGQVDQDRLVVTVLNSGSVRAQGRVDTLEVNALGDGNVHLEGLAARHVVVSVAGTGNVTVAPGVDAKISIIGSGNVRLTTRPAQIERNVIGSGRIIEQR